MEAHVDLIARAGYDEGAHTLASDIVLWPRISVLFANAAAFDRLSPGLQAGLRQAAIDARAIRLTEIGWEEDEGLTLLCRRGLELTAAGASALEELRQAVAPVYDAIAEDPIAAAVIDDAERLATSSGPASAVACTEAPVSPSASSRLHLPPSRAPGKRV